MTEQSNPEQQATAWQDELPKFPKKSNYHYSNPSTCSIQSQHADVIACEQAAEVCFYYEECHGDSKHQCPKCKRWYCDVCRELFLPIDPLFWVETAMMCPQCHYEVYELPKFQER